MKPRRPAILFALWLLSCTAICAQEAPIPAADELNGHPFAIRQTWVIGGTGNWDYLTLDAAARQLFIAHQNTVQVVDVTTGQVSGEVVLDPDGQTGYVSDGRAGLIRIFDRRSFQITANIPIAATPRSLVLEPQTGLLFVFGTMPVAPQKPDNSRTRLELARGKQEPAFCSPPTNQYPLPAGPQSLVTVIDPAKRANVALIELCGTMGAAQADGAGLVYFTITNLAQVGRLDIAAILNLRDNSQSATHARLNGLVKADGTLSLDLRTKGAAPSTGIFRTMVSEQLALYGLGSECQNATALALDAAHARLFAGCANQRVQVLNTDTGQAVANLTIGPGVDVMAYDAGRGLLFTANGGGYGSVSVIRQHVTDTYSVIQNLPTMEQARTLAVDASTGNVYLVTTLYGAKLDTPRNGIGKLKMNPVEGSFQVLVVGN
jgi:DNA-binding beta-propeller fold protein YncE